MSQFKCIAAQLLTTLSPGCRPGDGCPAVRWPFPRTSFLSAPAHWKANERTCTKLQDRSIRAGGQGSSGVYRFSLFLCWWKWTVSFSCESWSLWWVIDRQCSVGRGLFKKVQVRWRHRGVCSLEATEPGSALGLGLPVALSSRPTRPGWLWLERLPRSASQLAVVWFPSAAAPSTCPAINLPPPLDECVTARGMFQLKNSLRRSFPSSATDKYAFDIFIKKERKHIGKYVSFLTAQTKAPEVVKDWGLVRGKTGRGWVLPPKSPELGQVVRPLLRNHSSVATVSAGAPGRDAPRYFSQATSQHPKPPAKRTTQFRGKHGFERICR